MFNLANEHSIFCFTWWNIFCTYPGPAAVNVKRTMKGAFVKASKKQSKRKLKMNIKILICSSYTNYRNEIFYRSGEECV